MAKKPKKGKLEGGLSPSSTATEDGGSSGQGVQLVAHVKRLSRGKAIKPAAWAADLAASLQSVAALAEALAAVPGAGAEAGAAPSVQSAKKAKKRRHSDVAAEASPAAAGSGSLRQLAAAAAAVGRLLDLVAAFPLQHLAVGVAAAEEEGGEERSGGAAAALAHAALASGLAVCEVGLVALAQGSLQQVRAALCEIG